MAHVHFLLFEDFEALDAFGPAEIFSKCENIRGIRYFSVTGGAVRSAQGFDVQTEPLERLPAGGILVVPGGPGTRPLSSDPAFLSRLAGAARASLFVLTVCTGSALAAAAGILEGVRATSNKRAFDWVRRMPGSARWIARARWVRDGRFYTSSGVSAGMDMALGFIADQFGREESERIAKRIEYRWRDDPDDDPFAAPLPPACKPLA